METFNEAKSRILSELGAAGWSISSLTLKTPHATSPNGDARLWFKPQAIWLSYAGDELASDHRMTDIASAHSIVSDMRGVSAQKIIERVAYAMRSTSNPRRSNPSTRRRSSSSGGMKAEQIVGIVATIGIVGGAGWLIYNGTRG